MSMNMTNMAEDVSRTISDWKEEEALKITYQELRKLEREIMGWLTYSIATMTEEERQVFVNDCKEIEKGARS